MATTVTLEEAKAHLEEIVDALRPGEEIEIVDNERTLAKLIGGGRDRPARPRPGLGKGSVLFMAPDFDDTPEDFKEYLE